MGSSVLLGACSAERDTVTVSSSVDSAKAIVASGGFIVVELYSQSCVPCKVFDRAVEEDQTIQEALKGMVLVALDVDTAEGKMFATRHLVDVTPTYLLLNSSGDLIGRWTGYTEPQNWIRELSLLLANPVSVPERQARFASHPTFEDAVALGNLATSHREAFDHFLSARSLDLRSAKEADIPILLFRSAFFGVGTQEFTPKEVGAVIAEILQSEDPKPEYVMEIGERLLGVVHFVGIDVVAPYLEQVHPHVAAISSLELSMRRQEFLSQYAASVKEDSVNS